MSNKKNLLDQNKDEVKAYGTQKISKSGLQKSMILTHHHITILRKEEL